MASQHPTARAGGTPVEYMLQGDDCTALQLARVLTAAGFTAKLDLMEDGITNADDAEYKQLQLTASRARASADVDEGEEVGSATLSAVEAHTAMNKDEHASDAASFVKVLEVAAAGSARLNTETLQEALGRILLQYATELFSAHGRTAFTREDADA